MDWALYSCMDTIQIQARWYGGGYFDYMLYAAPTGTALQHSTFLCWFKSAQPRKRDAALTSNSPFEMVMAA